MLILGISAYYHDAAACIVKDGQIMAAAQEERFTRKKHDDSFPVHAIQYCLKEVGAQLDDLDYIAFYDKPFLKFERLLETYYNFSPKGFLSFVKAIPIWIKEKLFLKSEIKKNLKDIGLTKKNIKLLFPEHHLSHAASAYFASPFDSAAILTLDGVGEWATTAICKADSNSITKLKQLNFPHSIGLLYSAFTYFLGFRVNSGEYKLMGLAPYGRSGSREVEQYKTTIKAELIDIKSDGSLFMNPSYFSYAHGLRMIPDKKWEKLFGMEKRPAESALEQKHCDLAIAIQEVTEEIVLLLATTAKKISQSENLCLAGGVALNCVANGKLYRSGLFKNIFIQPAAGDAGGALGAALSVHHIYLGNVKSASTKDKMKGAYLGPRYADLDIEYAAKQKKLRYQKVDWSNLFDETASHIASGKVIGWFQDRMEFGPRALGNRSIIADPRNREMQLKLNLKIKYRESFRPFAPSVIMEDAHHFFDVVHDSPYMLLVDQVSANQQKVLPDDYKELSIKDKLYTERSTIPAITHVDNSARIQTVTSDSNPRYYSLLESVKEKTGIGMLINTSFNVRGEPIVCTPSDAMDCFCNTEMDVLVIENFIFEKDQQESESVEKTKSTTFELD